MRLYSEKRKQLPAEDLSARPTTARRTTMTTSGSNPVKVPSPSKDKSQRNGGSTAIAPVQTIKKKPIATGSKNQPVKGQSEAALGKRNPLETSSFSAADLASIKKAKPGDKVSAASKHNLATLVKSELQTQKEGADFFFLYVYKRLDKSIAANLQPPKLDLTTLRR